MRRLTMADWENIQTALDMVAADEWDSASYGDRPDFETTIDKVNERLSRRALQEGESS